MKITKGKQVKAQRVVIYGPEGIGKTTIASQFPNPLFIDTEEGSYHIDVARTDRPSSFAQVLSFVDELLKDRQGFETLVIDTADWLEKLVSQGVCAKHNVDGIEDLGYGKGYAYLKEDFGRLLDRLNDLCDRGMNIVVTAHVHLKKFEQPDEAGAYDRYELKLSKQCSPLLKEWPDMLLFCNYKTFVIEDATTKSKKAQGGQRTMYTTHRPSHDAKNRHGLADELPFEFASIAHCIPKLGQAKSEPVQARQEASVQTTASNELNSSSQFPPHLKALYDLMQQHKVTGFEIQQAVKAVGAYPLETKIEDYPADFVSGRLVASFDKVLNVIKQVKEQESK